MPIASKLFYFQRRRSPAPAPPEPPDPRRSLIREGPGRPRRALFNHKPGQELVPGNPRGTSECAVSARSIIEPARNTLFSPRLSNSVPNGQLPDAVQQARERLLQRLRSVDLSTRRQTSAYEINWAGTNLSSDFGISISGDVILGNTTNFPKFGVSLTNYKVEESTTEPFSNADKSMLIAVCSKPISELQEASKGTEGKDVASSVDCSICLERCGDVDGLIQLHCKHIFHSACLQRWLRSHSDCPYCRASVILTTE